MLITASSLTGQFQGCECVYHVPSLLYTMFPLTQARPLRVSYFIHNVSGLAAFLVDDIDDRDFLCMLIENMWEELPERKKR